MTDLKYTSLIALAEYKAPYNWMWSEFQNWGFTTMYKCSKTLLVKARARRWSITSRIFTSFALPQSLDKATEGHFE